MPILLHRNSFRTPLALIFDDATGQPIGLDDIDTRVGWMLDLVACAEAELVSRLWQPATFDVLAAGRERQDRTLPMQGHVAAARLGWSPTYGDDVYVPSRVTRVVTSHPVGTLRTLAHRDNAIAGLSSRFDPSTGRIAPPTAAAEHVPSGFARGVLRQFAARARRTAGASTERLRITDVQAPPQRSVMTRPSAADKQLSQRSTFSTSTAPSVSSGERSTGNWPSTSPVR